MIFSINRKIKKIKDSKDNLSDFINEYKPFIASTVSKIIGRYVEYGKDDELSIALEGF